MVKVLPFILFCLGAMICFLNFYLSFLRYPIYKLRGGKKEDYKWKSGFPLIGSFFLAISLLIFYKITWLLVLGLFLILLDTGGIHWFIGVMIYQYFSKGKKYE